MRDYVGSVVVVGSINVDTYLDVGAAVLPGQTVLATATRGRAGGKGANQAVAAARMGASTVLVGAVGDEPDGDALVASLLREGVDVSNVARVSGAPSGMALVLSYPSGENSIVVAAGANWKLTPARVRDCVSRLADRGGVVITQGEITQDCIRAAAHASEIRGSRLVFNCAPFAEPDASVLALADPLVVNEVEAHQLTGLSIDGPDSAFAALRTLRDRMRSAVITLGAQGACWMEGRQTGYEPSPALGRVIDTTGAGDAFVGTLGAALARAEPLEGAVRFGVAAGSYATLAVGAQSSFPSSDELLSAVRSWGAHAGPVERCET